MTPDLTTLELIDIAAAAVHGQGDKVSDFIRGSDYESLAGPTAILYTREARRDTDMFDATKFHTARGDELTFLVKERFGVDRYLDTHGQGMAKLARPTVAAGAGTIWAGTRITVFGSEPKYYRTVGNRAVEAGATTVLVAIEAVEIGPGTAADRITDLRIDDVLWDTTWTVSSLVCADGTKYESAADLIARVRTGRRDARVGQKKAIETACLNAGARRVLVLRSDFADLDGGLNVCYVGDLSWVGNAALVKACAIAVRAARVLGDHMQVLPMGRADLDIEAVIGLRDIPETMDTERLERIHRTSITQHLGGTAGGFTFSRSGISGAVIRHTPEVQSVNLISPAADVGILVDGAFPAVLYRYIISDIAIRYQGP